ncbi:MAG: fumarylacetoacetate hydrolase, partial [Halobacteriales archaeon]
MRYHRYESNAGPRLVVRTGDGTYDLTSVHSDLRTVSELLSAARLSGEPLTAITNSLIQDAETLAFEDCEDDLLLPLQPSEVWAAGVTYEISEKAREEESTLPDVYQHVYTADRPELFF